MKRHLYILAAALLALIPIAAGAAEKSCASVGELHFICGPHHPEDLVRIPGTQWIIVSGMGGSSPGSAPGPGDLYLLNAKSRHWQSIAQQALASIDRDTRLYGDCPAPDAARFVSHGLAIRPGEHGLHTLYAVNHGGRESVEIFAIDARGAQPQLKWTGCAVLTEGAWLNAVVPLPDRGFIVTSTFDPTDPQARDKMASGSYAGAVYEWQPGRGYARLAAANAGGDNGVAISRRRQVAVLQLVLRPRRDSCGARRQRRACGDAAGLPA